MDSSFVYAPRFFDDDFFRSIPLDSIKDAFNTIRIKIGDFFVEVLGFETRKEEDVLQDDVDVLDNTSSRLNVACFDIEKKIENGEYSFGIALPQSEINIIKHRQEMLDQSFSECFDETNDDRDVFSPVYEQLKFFIQTLDFEDCVVNASRKRERVDFNLFFDGGLFVSIAQDINSDENDDVMFSISRNKKKIIISRMNIHELMEKIKIVQKIAID